MWIEGKPEWTGNKIDPTAMIFNSEPNFNIMV